MSRRNKILLGTLLCTVIVAAAVVNSGLVRQHPLFTALWPQKEAAAPVNASQQLSSTASLPSNAADAGSPVMAPEKSAPAGFGSDSGLNAALSDRPDHVSDAGATSPDIDPQKTNGSEGTATNAQKGLSTSVPPLLESPAGENNILKLTKEGNATRGKVKINQGSSGDGSAQTILGITGMADGASMPSSQDSFIPFSMMEDVAQTLVSGYWPQGTHILAMSSGIITTSFSSLNARYGAQLVSGTGDLKEIAHLRQKKLDYILMPSMLEGLYALYGERLIRLINDEAQTKSRIRHKADIAEMYALYARLLNSTAGCIRCYVTQEKTRSLTEKFIASEQAAQTANIAYQEHAALAENDGRAVPRDIERQYRLKVAERERDRERLAASFRRFTDTRNMDTSDLVFVAKWLHRRSLTHSSGLDTLATVLERFSSRMERERQHALTL